MCANVSGISASRTRKTTKKNCNRIFSIVSSSIRAFPHTILEACFPRRIRFINRNLCVYRDGRWMSVIMSNWLFISASQVVVAVIGFFQFYSWWMARAMARKIKLKSGKFIRFKGFYFLLMLTSSAWKKNTKWQKRNNNKQNKNLSEPANSRVASWPEKNLLWWTRKQRKQHGIYCMTVPLIACFSFFFLSLFLSRVRLSLDNVCELSAECLCRDNGNEINHIHETKKKIWK